MHSCLPPKILLHSLQSLLACKKCLFAEYVYMFFELIVIAYYVSIALALLIQV